MSKLKKIMESRGLIQMDLVRELKVDPARVSMQINGIRQLPLKHQKKLAKILGISMGDLSNVLNNHERGKAKHDNKK